MLTYVYICVLSTLRWPSIACIHRRSAPFSNICVAIACRNRWQLPLSMPADLRYGNTAIVDAAHRQARHAVHRQEQRLTVGSYQHVRPRMVQIPRKPPQQLHRRPVTYTRYRLSAAEIKRDG